MEEKERPQAIMFWDIWSDTNANKSYAVYAIVDIQSKHQELMFSEKEMKNVD